MPKIAEIEATPNPNAVRFVLKDRLTWGIPRSFDSIESAAVDPLAAELFDIPNVINVYYVDNWITVTQDGGAQWQELVRELAVPIREADAMQKPETEEELVYKDDSPKLADIRKLLDEQVRPTLMAEGGDIQIVALEGNILTLRYFGACGTCPSAFASTLGAIKSLAQAIDPDLEVVVI